MNHVPCGENLDVCLQVTLVHGSAVCTATSKQPKINLLHIYRGGRDFAPRQIRGGKFRCGKFPGAPWILCGTPRQSPQCVLLVCEKFAENPEFAWEISRSI